MGNEKTKCKIVSGAPNVSIDYLKTKLKGDFFLIAADSGYKNCLKVGVIPDLIAGDFDSSEFPDINTEIIKLPVEKDDTDTFYCVKEAVRRGFSEIELLCAFGSRADHNYSNMLCIEYCRQNNVKCCISDAKNRITLVDDYICLDNSEYQFFSVFAFSEKAEGVSVKGSYYELDNAVMYHYQQFGQSNCFCGMPAKISVKNGTLLVIQSND